MLSGDMTEAEVGTLSRPVEGGAACQKTLDVLAHTSWDERAKQLGASEPTVDSALHHVVREALGETTLAQADATTVHDELAFLEPPKEPGLLGRLGHYQVH